MALMIATAMQAFDTTIANVALPQLEESLGGGIELGSWVMTSYLCASAITATLTGWLRRRYGARSLFIGSIGLFIAASGLCSLAPSAVALIQFRLAQGAAAGIIQPLAQATCSISTLSAITAGCWPSGERQLWPARSSGRSSAASSPT